MRLCSASVSGNPQHFIGSARSCHSPSLASAVKPPSPTPTALDQPTDPRTYFMMGSPPVPILDLNDLRSSSTRHQFSRSLILALRHHGAVLLTNPLPAAILTEAFARSQSLFSLPLHTKLLAPHPASPLHHRGYSAPGQEKLSAYALSASSNAHSADAEAEATASSPTDLRESYEIGSPLNTHEPNIWLPENALTGFRDWASRFFVTCHGVAEELLAAVEMGLGEEGPGDGAGTGSLVRSHADGYNHQLRLLHYPAVPIRELRSGRVVRLGEHCDWSTMTMLFQDDCGGLEVADLRAPGKFVPVPPVEGACVLTVGDLLMRWSDDALKSTLHRVGLPPSTGTSENEEQMMTKARYSIPFFISPHPETIVTPLPSCVDAKHPASYKPVKQIAYNRQKMGLQYSAE